MIIFDTETTGLPGADSLPLSKQPKIIELCAIKLDDDTLEEVGRFHSLIHPEQPLSDEIKRITRLKDSDFKGMKPFGFHYPEICELFLGERFLIAHNLAFDANLLSLDLRRIGKLLEFPWPPTRICTVDATLHIKGYRLNLTKLFGHLFDGGTFPNAHRAAADTEALAMCVRKLIENGTLHLQKK